MDPNSILKTGEKVLNTAPTFYNDALEPTVKETGKVLERIPKMINAALAPLNIWILKKEYNINETKKILAKKLENIDPNKIVSPEPYVAVPALQAISYSINSDELRNMYANLLAKSMNFDTKDVVHPSFAEIIKQMSPFDAKLLKLFSNSPQHPIIKIRYELSEQNPIGFDYINHIVSPELGISIQTYKKYAVSIDNLIRLNLVNVTYNNYLTDQKFYNNILNSTFIKQLDPKSNLPENYGHVNFKKGILTITNLGNSFTSICIF